MPLISILIKYSIPFCICIEIATKLLYIIINVSEGTAVLSELVLVSLPKILRNRSAFICSFIQLASWNTF